MSTKHTPGPRNKAMKHIYRNDFHGTYYASPKSPAELAAIEQRLATDGATRADRNQARRMHAALCGQADCTCGDVFGCRPGVAELAARATSE